MNAMQIFGLQFLLSLIVYGLLARWHVAPRLRTLPSAAALSPLLFLHASRHLGLVFLVPTVVGPALQPEFARPAAYGDLVAALLALLALVALRGRWPGALGLVWLFNVVGVLDLLYALSQGVRLGVLVGAAYYIPTFVVPALLVTHVMIFAVLFRTAR
jgi:hypothetical protein